MNIEMYSKAMNEIDIDTKQVSMRFFNETLGGTCQNQQKTNTGELVLKKVFRILVPTVLVIMIFIGLNFLPKSIHPVTITAYAVGLDGGAELSKESISIKTESVFNFQSQSASSGTTYFDIDFICEDKNITSITYQISNESITIENRHNQSAWFVKEIMRDEFKLYYELGEYEGFSSDGSYEVIQMIGNEYTVDYDEQWNNDYMLSVNLNIDSDGHYNPEVVDIIMTIGYKDGQKVSKVLRITPIVNSYGNPSGIDRLDISLLN